MQDYKIYGQSVQNGEPTPTEPIPVYSLGERSRNLFNITDINSCTATYTINGNELTTTGINQYNDVTYKINVSGNTDYVFDCEIISSDTSSGHIAISEFDKDGNIIFQNVVIFDYGFNPLSFKTNSSTCWLMLYVRNRKENVTTTFKNIQLEEGSTATDYIPYNAVEVNSRGKNLLDANTVLVDNGFILQEDGSFYIENNNAVYTKTFFTNNSDADYVTISYDYKFASSDLTYGTFPYIHYKDGTTDYANSRMTISTTYQHHVYMSRLSKKVEYITWTYGTSNNSTWIKNIQIEVGRTETSYEPYYEPITTAIDLTGHEPLRKIGDVADYIDYANSRIVRNVGAVDLGTLTWGKSTNNIFRAVRAIQPDVNIETTHNALCSAFIFETNYASVDNSFLVTHDGWIWINSSIYATMNTEEFKNSMSSVTVYYQLATPIYEDISLPSIPTAGETTTITVDGDIQPSNVNVTYLQNK